MKTAGTFLQNLCIFFGAGCIFFGAGSLVSCSRQEDGAASSAPGAGSAQVAVLRGQPARFDSLRLCLPRRGEIFDSLRRAEPERWRLVADLLGYFYAARWSPAGGADGGMPMDAETVGKRLAQSPEWWSVPEESSPYRQYAELQRQAARLADFATAGGEEEALRRGLERFMQLYLDERCRLQLAAQPRARALAPLLEAERGAWLRHLEVEKQFMLTLYADSLNLVADELGRRTGSFLASRRERRAEADRNLLFGLTSEADFALPRQEYVTWATTIGQYDRLREKYTRYQAPHLIRALNEEYNAWFAYMQTRARIEEALGESAAGKVYDTTTRILKRRHLNDLKTW